MTSHSRTFVAATVALGYACTTHPTPDPAFAPTPQRGSRPPEQAAADQDTTARPQRPQQPRPYNQVITAEAKTQTGLFKVHQIAERFYYEIPRDELNRDQLLLLRGAGDGSSGSNMVVRWQRHGNRVFLRQYSYGVMADSTEAIHRAVAPLNEGPILASFNVEAWGPDSAAVIEVAKLFTTVRPHTSDALLES
jgi:hypothetical protein